VVDPIVLDEVGPGMEAWDEEVFGPLVGVRPYDDPDEAIGLANSTRFGLQEGVSTMDLNVARSAIDDLRVGGVVMNDVPTWRADNMPYGGVGDSGNTTEGPFEAAMSMTDETLFLLR